jgi:hypothetical protein
VDPQKILPIVLNDIQKGVEAVGELCTASPDACSKIFPQGSKPNVGLEWFEFGYTVNEFFSDFGNFINNIPDTKPKRPHPTSTGTPVVIPTPAPHPNIIGTPTMYIQ